MLGPAAPRASTSTSHDRATTVRRLSVNLPAILEALGAELAATSEPVRLTVLQRDAHGGGVWTLRVDPGRGEGRFDESLEAARAYWPGGGGDVTAVLSDPPAVSLRYVASSPPPVGDFVWLYPPKFLEPLQRVWLRDDIVCAASEVLDACAEPSKRFVAPKPSASRLLRARQQEAFSLVAQRVSFLDGPPGTGKTHTLSALIVAAIEQGAAMRVLLVSSTNAAVDLALLRADAFASGPRATRGLVRSGYHYDPASYVGKEHLIPSGSSQLLASLAIVHARRPPRADAAGMAAWKSEEQAARRRLRANAAEARQGARVVAMTVANALSLYEELVAEPFDLVVFDEASQVGRAAALAVASLGRRVLFAGDPQQLGPVVVSDDAAARRWLGTSMFLHRSQGAPNACFLDEQSRMAPDICRVVSDVFYGGKLRVAEGCQDDARWRQERTIGEGGRQLALVPVEPGGSRVRASSSQAMAALAQQLQREGVSPSDVLVLTPFRKQREALRVALDDAGASEIEVSTVHRAQGREALVVVFDPVDEAGDFLEGEQGRRLVNVALSRAKGRLVLLVAKERLAHAGLLRALVERISGEHSALPAPLFRLSDLAPLVATGASLTGALLSLGPNRRCEVLSWDTQLRRGEALDARGRRITLAAQPSAPAHIAPAPSLPGWLTRYAKRSFADPLWSQEADSAALTRRLQAMAAASRLSHLPGLRGELALALWLERQGVAIEEVAVRVEGNRASVLVDLVTRGRSALFLVRSTSPAAPEQLPRFLADASLIARGAFSRASPPIDRAYCVCKAGFSAPALAHLRQSDVLPIQQASELGAIA